MINKIANISDWKSLTLSLDECNIITGDEPCSKIWGDMVRIIWTRTDRGLPLTPKTIKCINKLICALNRQMLYAILRRSGENHAQ